MRVSAVQMRIRTGDVRANLEEAARGVEEALRRGSHLVLLPEMWSTGFAYREFPDLARAAWPAALDLMQAYARRGRAWVAGSVPEVEGGRVYNALVWVDPAGEVAAVYRKLHLFPPMGEAEQLAAGDRVVAVATGEGLVGGLICYDLRFPELARRLALEGCWALCVPAQWPHPRLHHWQTLLMARAIENQVWVIAANRVGAEGRLEFFGHSAVISPWGEIVEGAGEEERAVVTADISRAQVDEVRERLPCLGQRRADVYGNCLPPEAP